jgi:hypothetical protein
MPVAPCSLLKTLTIQYTTSSIMPDSGYTVQWRAVGDDVWYTEPNKRANPITISGVPSCYPLEVRLMVNCGSGLEVVETFGVEGSGSSSCYTYEFLDTVEYTYTPCGGTTSVSIYNSSNSELSQTVCAVDGTVSGGAFIRRDQCRGTQG